MKTMLHTLRVVLVLLVCLHAGAQEKSLCGLTDKDMLDVRLRVHENIIRLVKAGKLDTSNWEYKIDPVTMTQNDMQQHAVPTNIRFAWPMRAKNPEEYPYYNIGNYIDLDTTGTECIKDYNGGYRTYNGHHGTDIGIGPYRWKRYYEGSVYAIAAAPGIIVEKVDGRVDDQCTWNNSDTVTRGNHIVILHNDGHTVSFYMHLKAGSLTEIEVGEQVNTGTIIGVVASSGNSTGPHLHFQVNVGWSHPTEDKGHFVDPWAGPSNYTTTASLWINQKPYDEPAVYAMETLLGTNHDSYSNNCDKTIDLSNLKNSFSPGNTVTLYTWYRDWIDASKLTMGVRRPDGTAQATWINVSNTCNDAIEVCKNTFQPGVPCRLKITNHNFILPADAPTGTWTYWVTFGGVTYNHYFAVSCPANILVATAQIGSKGYRVSNNITSTATISSASSNHVQFHADNAVILSPGFTATQGCTFRATNYGCNKIE